MRVDIRHLTKTFGAYTALDEVSVDIRKGEFCALLGPSGSASSPASSSPIAARFVSAARTCSAAVRANVRSVSYSSTTRCSAT
jgi:sulfate transport system ATP-binding protein